MELAIVIPVFNEEDTIQDLVEDLYTILSAEGIAYTSYIINDGSTDSSLQILESLVHRIPNLMLYSETNRGHGPSLLKGYHTASNHRWIFQFDSDYQYSLSAFIDLWNAREQYDLLIAERETRSASPARRCITAVLSGLVHLLYGRGKRDINTPYRLMRTSALKPALEKMDANSFAPNALITAYFIKQDLRIYSTSPKIRECIKVKQSKLTLPIFKGCAKSILDLVSFRFKI